MVDFSCTNTRIASNKTRMYGFGYSSYFATEADASTYLPVEAPSPVPERKTPRERRGEAWIASDDAGTRYVCYSLSETEAHLAACESDAEEVSVPDTLAGKMIAEIGTDAFASCTHLHVLRCPAQATYMDPHAFRRCNTLRTLELPRRLDYLDRSLASACPSLETLLLPDALVRLPAKLFNASSIKHLRIGRDTRLIDEGAFRGTSLESVSVAPDNVFLATDGHALFSRENDMLITLAVSTDVYTVPYGCRAIARKAFAYDSALRHVELPDTLREIGAYAFMNTPLEAFEAPKSLQVIGEKAFFHCARLVRADLNEGLVRIGESAFAHTALSSVHLPASMRSIGLSAFAHCKPLENVDAAAGGAAGAGNVGNSATGTPTPATASPTDITPHIEIEHANPVLRVDEHGGLYQLEEDGWVLRELTDARTTFYRVAQGTVRIGESAAANCTSLEHVELPEGLTGIGTRAFRGCSNLAHATFPESLQSIGLEAFFEAALQSVYLPEHCEDLGELALATSGAGRIARGATVGCVSVHAGNHRFYTHQGMLCERNAACAPRGGDAVVLYFGPDEDAMLPPSVTAIAPYAFAGVHGLRHLHIHRHVDYVGVCGLAVGEVVDVITLELPKPISGRQSVDVHFPHTDAGRRAMLRAFGSTSLNVPVILECSDDAVFWAPSLFDRAAWSLERLYAPLLISDVNRSRFSSLIKANVLAVCEEFAARDYARGFDQLLALGYLNEDNITCVIDKISAAHDVAMTGYLLELKHRHLRSAALDFDL